MRRPGRTALIASCIAGGAAVAMAIILWAVSMYVERTVQARLYEDMASLPRRDVGLVLGTARRTSGGMNAFYSARIEAAAALFHAGKIGHIIVSGSNPSRYYNEPVQMRQDLVDRAVPADSITEDRAGFRTLDSIVRADKVMGQRSFTVVTQRFHAARAVYIGTHFGLDVIAYCAENPPEREIYTSYLRESGARLKALLDINLLNTQPHRLGEPIPIRMDPGGSSGGGALKVD